jgi:hypothetical protein
MAEDEERRTESLLPYNDWTEEALRHVVASAIGHAARHGLPGEHHFYITFRTDYPGVVIPPHLRAQYPEAMTIVLQHQFWNLKLDEQAKAISVGLSFGGVETTLVIPLAAVTAFADPHVRFVLQFSTPGAPPDEPAADEEAETDAETEAGDAAEAPSEVVSLDAFRRRTPPKS